MRLSAVIASLVPRLLIAVPVFIVVVGMVVCAVVIDVLSPLRMPRPLPIDVVSSSFDRG